MLEDIGNKKNLVACYFYYTKPVYFISRCCVAIFWTTKIRSMFDIVAGSMRGMHF